MQLRDETRFQEVAWDSEGKWCGDGKEPRLFPKLQRKHQCRRARECGRFVCYHCGRCVPWCFGASGNALESVLCDDCWCALPAVYKS